VATKSAVATRRKAAMHKGAVRFLEKVFPIFLWFLIFRFFPPSVCPHQRCPNEPQYNCSLINNVCQCLNSCSLHNADPKNCPANFCPQNAAVRCRYNPNSLLCSCPLDCINFNNDPNGCAQASCPDTTPCRYDTTSGLCNCPTNPTDCSIYNHDQNVCVSSQCPNHPGAKCVWQQATGICTCG